MIFLANLSKVDGYVGGDCRIIPLLSTLTLTTLKLDALSVDNFVKQNVFRTYIQYLQKVAKLKVQELGS